ncbi:MAG: DUF4831 family protein [Bacteroides sp.]|jgi:hypothetical protein|nr:DUF4831 family protein [Bacteroides sp.]
MKRIFPILLIIFFLTVPACQSQKPLIVTHVRSADIKAGTQGLFYVLPRTVITVDVTVKRMQQVPGPYAEFAMKYLGLQNVIRYPSTSYEISEITINSYSEPDPDQFYFVEFPEKADEAYPLFLSLSETGLIQSINKSFNNQEFLRGMDETREHGYYGSDATFNYFIDSNLQEKVDTILERVRVDTLTVERQTLRRSMVEKSPEVRAKEVADFILEVRDKRFEIIHGYAEVPYSKEALEYMFTEMAKMEEDYLQLFKGLESTSEIYYRYTIVPNPDLGTSPRTLFYFSEREGVLPAEKREGTPITLSTERNETTRQLGVFVNRNVDPELPANGFYYRVPEHANVVIRTGNTIRASARLLINQFGVVTNLPDYIEEVEFYPNTGSVRSYGKLEEKE